VSGLNAVEIRVNDPLLYAAPLPFEARYFPYGFPVDIAGDTREVLEAASESWGVYEPRFDSPPIRVHVITTDGSHELPPPPVMRGQRHLLASVADQDNFTFCDRLQRFGCCCVTRATLADSVFFRWHFLDAVIYMLLEFNYFTAVHAASVARDGAGVLLHGNSGTGKSTLAYACARQGWTYISDDASVVLWGGDRTVLGEPHHFRFRAEAPEIFPELRGLTAGRELDRKPTIEVRTAGLPIRTAAECRVESIVFLDRRPGASARLMHISKEEARERLLSDMPIFDPELQERRKAAIASVAEAHAFGLQYGSFEEALPLLERVAGAGGTA
jgi:hypothetical protein